MNREVYSLADLLKNSTREYIDRIPTESRHELTARNILNSMLNRNETWFPAISALVVYPVQKWAAEIRMNQKIDTSALCRLMDEEGTFFGMKATRYMNKHMTALKETDIELELVSQILDPKKTKITGENKLKVLNSIHGIRQPDQSKYMIEKYYEDAISEVCQIYNEIFREIGRRIIDAAGQDGDDEREAYHNTDWLIRNADQFGDRVESSGIDYEAVYHSLRKCVRCLSTYSIDGTELYETVNAVFLGATEAAAAESLKKSRTYIRNRYRTGIEILSYLIWGYSSRENLQEYI